MHEPRRRRRSLVGRALAAVLLVAALALTSTERDVGEVRLTLLVERGEESEAAEVAVVPDAGHEGHVAS